MTTQWKRQIEANAMRNVVLLILLFFSTNITTYAQENDWQALYNEGYVLYQQKQYDRASVIAQKALQVAEQEFGSNSQPVGASLTNLAMIYQAQGQNGQAVPLFKRALEIVEKALGADDINVAAGLFNLGNSYKDQGQYAQAEPLIKRALLIWEKALGPDHLNVAMSLNYLAGLYLKQGKYAQAESLYKRAQAIYEKMYGPEHPYVAANLNGLAESYRGQSQYAQAEPLYKRALSIDEKSLGSEHMGLATDLNNLAMLYYDQGQYEKAEPLFKRALVIKEKALGSEHPDVGMELNGLAGLYDIQGKYAQAEPLFKRSLAILEKSLGPDHPEVGRVLNNLVALYVHQGRYAQAESLMNRSLAILEKSLGLDHPDVAIALSGLAGIYDRQGQYDKAEPLYKRVLEIDEKALGPEHQGLAIDLNNLASLYRNQGQYAQAEPLYKRSLAIYEKILGPDHPNLATILDNIALLNQKQGQYAQALALERRVSSISRRRIVAGGTGESAAQVASNNKFGFNLHLSLLAKNPNKEPTDKIADEAFQVVQLEQASGTAAAIAKMAARFASGDDALASLVKQKQDASDRHTKEEAQLVSAVSMPSYKRNATDEQRLHDDISKTEIEIEKIDAELTHRFPEYQSLTRPEPISISQVRALLKPGEAMLAYALGDNQSATDFHSFLWVVKPDGVVFLPLEANAKDTSAQVAKVRAEMDMDVGGFKPVSVGLLHDLYQNFFAPALPHLNGVSHVMVVPAGPLQSLPFSMLVASPPPDIKSDADYRKVDWLARHYAVSVLPSIGSIQAFRQFAKAGHSQEPFAGFGDPLIGSDSGSTRGKRAKIDVATVYRNLVVTANANKNNSPTITATEIADVEAIRGAPRLPETADEIRAMAKVLKASPNSIWLEENATETNVKHIDLSKYRTIAFATHGVMAGELKGVGEPGLILTPPKVGTIEDDGYLAAGEIAKLKLNADWVVLSACNTAAADGTPGAEGFSGLAKAFFYAGARSLLVSNWPVASEATVPLTTGMLREYEANPAQGKAEAQRKAMMALMDTPNHPEYAHPMFWAPFVVVGEGGAGK